MSQVTSGYGGASGTSLTVDDGGTGASSGSATAFFQLLDFTVPYYQGSVITYAPLNGAKFREYSVPGIEKNGKGSFEIMYCKADYNRCVGIKNKVHTFVITMPDEDGSGAIAAVSVSFKAIVTSCEVDVKADSLVMIKVGYDLEGTDITIS